MTPISAKPRQPRGKSHPSLQCHNLQDWVADGAVWSYPVSAKGGPAFGGNPQTEKPVEIQEGSSFSSFSTRTRGSSSFAIRLFSALSGFNHECQRRSIRFLYSELTAFVTCWSPHASSTGGRSSRNRICFNEIFYTAISTSWTPERGPCRKPSGRRLRPLLIVANGFTSHQRMFVDGNIFPAIAVGRLEWSFRFLAGNDQKERKTGP